MTNKNYPWLEVQRHDVTHQMTKNKALAVKTFKRGDKGTKLYKYVGQRKFLIDSK